MQPKMPFNKPTDAGKEMYYGGQAAALSKLAVPPSGRP